MPTADIASFLPTDINLVFDVAGTPGLQVDGISGLFFDSNVFAGQARLAFTDGAIPLPAGLPLLIGGLGALAVARKRRKAT